MILRVVEWIAEEEWMMKKLAFAITLTMLTLPFAASAQQVPAAGSVRAECAADAQSLCAGMNPQDQHKCLMANISKVSQGCGTALANARSAMKEYAQACGADIRQYCGNQAPGPARHQCVVANTPQFSQACQAALAAQHAPGR
jgi:hypothetical protein